jgi:hypothetical protein
VKNLKEVVPYATSPKAARKLEKKHGQQTYGPGTFGIEIEFDIPPSPELTKYILDYVPSNILGEIASKNERAADFKDAYRDWLSNERERLNKNVFRDWDDEYGPPDFDDWEARNPEPDKFEGGYKTEEYSDWELKRKSVEQEFSIWERHGANDYMGSYSADIGEEIFDYVDPRHMANIVVQTYKYMPQLAKMVKGNTSYGAIQKVSDFIEEFPGEKVGHAPTATTWDVGMDGDNVEIRSRHLKLENFDLIVEIFDFLSDQGYKMTSDTSAHVHVGLPKDFDAFSLLALTTLVDEKAVKSAVGDRNLEDWAKLRNAFESKVCKKIEKVFDETNTKSLRFSEESLSKFLKETAEKFSGTNIRSFFTYNTVEFRYFGSNIKSTDSFLSWIKYFMLLPVVAKNRKQVKIGKLYFTRHPDGAIIASLDRKQ